MLLNMNIYERKEDIIELSLRAYQEFNLAKTILSVEHQWENVEIRY